MDQDYGKTMGVLENDALAYLLNAAPGDYFGRIHVEQLCMNGDPALHMYQMPTDYDVEASTVSVNPYFYFDKQYVVHGQCEVL